MKCEELKKKIIDFIEDKGNVKDKEKIKDHLEKCESCKSLYNDFLFILNQSKKIPTYQMDENFWKLKLNFIIEKGKIYSRMLKPVYIGISIFILVFSTILFTKIYTPEKKKILSTLKIEIFNHELPFSEEEMIKYTDYMKEEEAEKIIDFIFAGL